MIAILAACLDMSGNVWLRKESTLCSSQAPQIRRVMYS